MRLGAIGLLFAVSSLRALPWSMAPTDLPLDPALHLGVLPNGLRFAVLPNHEPKDRVSLRLVVAVGSLYENDHERGLAHFIEHMAFRGTQKYPRSTLVPALEKMGMGLGPDTAAFTSYDFTDYQLELPDRSAATLSYGLDVLREFAEQVTFAPDDILTERGVVLSEMAARDTPDSRWTDHNAAFLWPASRRANRSPIGTKAALDSFQTGDFRAFYDAWYRPERMALIVVGEVDPVQVEAEIRRAFASLRGRGPARPEPLDLVPGSSSPSRIEEWKDPGLVGVGVVLEHPRVLGPDRWQRRARREGIQATLAIAMLQRRFRDLTHEPNAVVLEAGVHVNDTVTGWSSAIISTSARANSIRRALTDTDQEFRRAYELGFSPQELVEAKANYRSALTQFARTAETRSSGQLAGDLMNFLLNGVPFCAPAAVLADQLPIVERATLKECLAALRSSWGSESPHRLIAFNSQVDFPLTAVTAVLQASRALPVKARAPARRVTFPYTDFGRPGQLVHRRRLDDLDITMGEFTNGVRLDLKPTQFEAKAVTFSVRVGRGKQSMPGKPGLSRLADDGFLTGGLKACSSEQLDSVLAGHAISLGFQVASDAFLFYGRCSPEDLTITLQLVAAFLTDAGFRPEALNSVRGGLHAALSQQRNSSGGLVDYFLEPYLTSFDPRFWPGSDRDLENRDYFELAAWLRPELASGAVEIALVGDFDVEAAVHAAARSLGAIAHRPAPAALDWQPVAFAPVHSRFLLFSPATVRDNCVAVCWPAPSIVTVPDNRRCDVVARVLRERIMTRVREDLGATYSPEVSFAFDLGMPGHSYLVAKVAATREHAARVEQIILTEAAALARQPVDADTFARAREPLLRERTDQLRNNPYWDYVVMGDLQQRPEKIEYARSRDQDYESITAADVERFAARIFHPEAAYRFWTVQAPAPAEMPGS